MRKILYISGTRADYGLMREVLFSIRRHPKLNVEIGATGMHLMKDFGGTLKEIKKDKFKIHPIEAIYKKDDEKSVVEFISNFILKLAGKISKIKPDIILLIGDRPEMLGGAIVGVYLKIPVAHIHGGEVTSTVDEITRHAITKLSHLHFVANKNAAKRVINLGENPWRVFIVGAPGLDSILKKERLDLKETIIRKYHLNLSNPILLVIQHPVTGEVRNPAMQMRETMEALKELGYQTIVLYPNADPGGEKMIKVIEKYRKYPFIRIYKSLPHEDYINLIKIVTVMIGNSSSGIIEAPAVYLPVVNIGKREEKRDRADNLIDVGYHKGQIKKAIEMAIYNRKFREKIEKCKSPYGDGQATLRITRILNKIKINKRLIQKQITY